MMIGRIVRETAGVILFVAPVALALLLVVRQRYRVPNGRTTGDNSAAVLWLCTYIVLLAMVTLAPPPISRSNGHFGSNIVPLVYSARCFVPNPGQPSTTAFCLESIIGNFALFFPLGFLLPMVLRQTASLRTIVVVAAMASISIEFLQYAGRWVGNPRWSDVDDVIFNVIGAIVGYAMLQLIRAARFTRIRDTR